MSGLEFDSITKAFDATLALSEFSLTVASGEFVSLLGPSGCGKSTALRVGAGFERAHSGRVRIGGVDRTGEGPRLRNVGIVFQSYSLFPNLTVLENLAFGLRTRKVGSDERRRRCEEMLELVQLPGLAKRYPHQLSGGQQQRVALARALVIKPDVLLLDEPLSALDAHVRRSLRDEIRRLQAELGITTLFVTHDQEEALAVSDRVGVMSGGVLQQIASPEEIYLRPANAFVARFVGETSRVEVGDAHFLIRPEHVEFERFEPGTTAPPVGDLDAIVLHGHVKTTTFEGARTSSVLSASSLVASSPPADLLATSFAPAALAPGTPVRVTLRREHLIAHV